MAVDGAVVALGAGTALALGAAVIVLGPLWNGAEAEPAPSRSPRAPEPDDDGSTRAEGVSAVEALREIEFDRATGKLSDEDYATLKAAYTRDALAELRSAQGRGSGPAPIAAEPVVDRVEEALRAYRIRQSATRGDGRVCPVDGPRPESDATFCSACGRFLAGHCPNCGAECDRDGQRFCERCGSNLAAGPAAALAATAV